MNHSLWLGFILIAAMIGLGVTSYGAWVVLSNAFGFGLVFGGLSAALLVAYPLERLRSVFTRVASLFGSSSVPPVEACIDEAMRIARLAHAGGGVLAVANEGRDFAEGFLQRAIVAAIATGESQETRRIMEADIRQRRSDAQEDIQVLRSAATMAPMFGLLGTLLGMMRLLGNMADPATMGPAMALALSSAFFGIAIANCACLPLAGQMRQRVVQQTIALEVLLEGVLDLLAGKPPYLVSVHLASYSEERRSQLDQPRGAPRGVPTR